MVLSIKNSLADELARELAGLTGETITEAVVGSLEVRLEIERRRRIRPELGDIVMRFSELVIEIDADPNEILGYDEHGLPS